MYKNCVKCNSEKILSDFYKKRNSYTGKCKLCLCEEQKERTLHNKEVLKEKRKVYKLKNKERISQYQLKYTQNPEYKHIRAKADKKYYESNKVTIKDKRREYIYANPTARLDNSLRARVSQALKGTYKLSLKELIGCCLNSLKKWIEYQFTIEMNWENYGVLWELDHVRPCSSYNLDNIDDLKSCFSWKNTRPLLKLENLAKSNTYTKQIAINHKKILDSYTESL